MLLADDLADDLICSWLDCRWDSAHPRWSLPQKPASLALGKLLAALTGQALVNAHRAVNDAVATAKVCPSHALSHCLCVCVSISLSLSLSLRVCVVVGLG